MSESSLSAVQAGILQSLLPSCPESDAGPYPLSLAQESIWFIEQMTPGTATYNLPAAWHLKGQLDTSALQRSLDEMVRRHEILRTRILAQNGQPQQLILGSARIKLELIDLPAGHYSDSELQHRLQTEAQLPFDLSCAPLARAVLFRRTAQEHLLLLNLHHIISDAWSQGVLLRELNSWYGTFTNLAGSVPALPIQYADFTLWQREMLSSEAGRCDLDYWRQKLSPPVKLLSLPADHPRPRTLSFKGATQFFDVSPDLSASLRELSRGKGVTLFMTLLAAFKTLLHRYTQEEDIIVGSPMAGRQRVEVEALIGLFVNTHALRSNVGGDPTFSELLGRIREVVLGAYAHQELPGESVTQVLHHTRNAARHPLFEVVFGWQGAELDGPQWPGLEAAQVELDTGTAKFAWTVLATERQNGSLRLRSEFSTDLFEAETMMRLMRQFLTLLESAAAAPGTRLSELPLMRSPEREQLLIQFNQTAAEYERNASVHELFERRTQENPETVALSFTGQEMTYADLNARANQLARHLQTCGVVVGMKVALSLDRSFELIIALLAILKAGAAYVPLDRAYPAERLSLILEDCGCSVLLTDAAWPLSQSELPGGLQVIRLDREKARLETQSRDNLQTVATPTATAYVMYTSGSTGTPKGVLVPHRAVVRLVRNTNYLKFSREQVFLQLAPIAFDASTFEIWGALLNGARLVILPPQLPSLEELGRTMLQNRITTLWLTAGLFHQMIDYQLENLHGLKYLLAGGDVLSPAHVARASRKLSGCQLINGYGPTENTTFTCCYPIRGVWPEDRAVPIGHPISNTRVYVLDSHMVPVPIGVPGELYTSGDGLAEGYLNQPSLTAEKFLPNPFPNDPCSRLYRTGDVVRWSADGTLEFLCRNDGQVKIRGYRVEPGEIESALLHHPAVQAAAAVARSDRTGTNQLIAYVASWPGRTPVQDELRAYLQSKLPSYMVPARILSLNALPLTPNGKIDRRALPEPEQDSAPSKPRFQIPPRTPIEETLCAIWSEVLARPGIGVQDDFFELGGHSLLATQVISRISKSCQVDLPVVAIFEAPTIERLAAAIEQAQRDHPLCASSAIARAAQPRAVELLEQLDQFTEEQLDQLLRDPELNSLL